MRLLNKDIILWMLAVLIFVFNWKTGIVILIFIMIIYLWRMSIEWAKLEHLKTLAWEKERNEHNK
jgi:ABC-type transport system involved in cytochrome bd biosynthesis fused ATPase/permease subunit